MKNSRSLLAWLVSVLLIGCTGQQPPAIPSTTQPPTAFVIHTPSTLPTLAFMQPTTILRTETPLPTAIETSETPFSIDRLRMVYTKNGNLYLRDGNTQPLQLTNSGKDHDPAISHDANKVVFYRGEGFHTVYSINADRSQEQLIIESQSLPILGRGEIYSLAFAPDTHKLLFNTYLCETTPYLYVYPSCTIGIFLADSDNGEIDEIRAGLSGYVGQSRNFEVSPNGNYLSIATSGHIDLHYMDGDVLYQDVITYPRTVPNEFVPIQNWFPDSSALIAILPASYTNEVTGPPSAYSAWRYSLDGNTSVQIPLEPPIMWNSGCSFSVSPDRNWIFYYGDATKGFGLYIGNLNDGTAQAYELEWDSNCPVPNSKQWSPDSRYFAFSEVLGGIDGTLIPYNGHFLGWIDAVHYFFETIEENNRKIYIGKIGGENIVMPEEFQWSPTYVLVNK